MIFQFLLPNEMINLSNSNSYFNNYLKKDFIWKQMFESIFIAPSLKSISNWKTEFIEYYQKLPSNSCNPNIYMKASFKVDTNAFDYIKSLLNYSISFFSLNTHSF